MLRSFHILVRGSLTIGRRQLDVYVDDSDAECKVRCLKQVKERCSIYC